MTNLIFVTGANSQTALTFKAFFASQCQSWFFFSHQQLDITSPQSIEKAILPILCRFLDYNEALIINLAAYTDVNGAEQNETLATTINAIGVSNLTNFALKHKLGIIHLSSDFVFDGNTTNAYNETDITNPLSVYGKTKLAGENMLHPLAIQQRALVIRTSWLFSPFGNNFLLTIYEKIKNSHPLQVVNDQLGCPTSAIQLCRFIIHAVNLFTKEHLFRTTLLHLSNQGIASWYDFACAINLFAGQKGVVKAINSNKYPTVAIRPKYSKLNLDLLKERYAYEPWHWLLAVKEVIEWLSVKDEK